MVRIAIVLLLGLAVLPLHADDLDTKRQETERKEQADNNYFVLGVLPNSFGNVDGHLGVRLNCGRRFFTRITLETTGIRETKDAFSPSPLGLNAILNQEFHLNATADLFGWRFVHKDLNRKGKRLSLALIPFAGYTLSRVERRESYVFTDLTAVLNREYQLNLMQGFGKLQFTWSNPKRFFIRFYGACGLFLGMMDQANTIYWNESGTEIQDSYRADQDIMAFGWRAGAEMMFNLGIVSLRLSGDFMESKGRMKYIYFNIISGSNGEGDDEFHYLSWIARAELTLNFIKLGKNSPSAFYGIEQQGLRINKDGDWVDLTSDNTKTEIVHKFGVMMRY